MRIRWQSFIDSDEHPDYFELLRAQLRNGAGRGVEFELVGIKPSASELHRLNEARYGVLAVANAVAARRDGCDAYVLGHFQDSGLFDARSAVAIPVLGMGEAAMLHACTLGLRVGLVAINRVFISVLREQIARYGLTKRVIGVSAVDQLTVADYVRAGVDGAVLERVLAGFERAVQPLLAADVEVLVPAGGLLAMALSRKPGLEVGGAAVLNPIPVLGTYAEAAVTLQRLGLPTASRKTTFALASERVCREFLQEIPFD